MIYNLIPYHNKFGSGIFFIRQLQHRLVLNFKRTDILKQYYLTIANLDHTFWNILLRRPFLFFLPRLEDGGIRQTLNAEGKESNLLLSIPSVLIYFKLERWDDHFVSVGKERKKKTKTTAYLTKVMQNTIKSTNYCTENRIPNLCVHKIYLNGHRMNYC